MEVSKTINLVFAQYTSVIGNPEANVEKLLTTVVQMYEPGVTNIFVFPELYLTGPNLKSLSYLYAETAEPPGHMLSLIIKRMRDEGLKDTYVIVGFIEKSLKVKGIVYNSVAVVSEKGIVHVYRKRHLPAHPPFEDAMYFRPYREVKVAPFDVGGVKVGIEIGFDIMYPEITRAMVIAGADIVITVAAVPHPYTRLFLDVAKARAIENCVYVAFLNAAGVYDELVMGGMSTVFDPMGRVIAQASEIDEDIMSVKICEGEFERFRTIWPVIRYWSKSDIDVLSTAHTEHKY